MDTRAIVCVDMRVTPPGLGCVMWVCELAEREGGWRGHPSSCTHRGRLWFRTDALVFVRHPRATTSCPCCTLINPSCPLPPCISPPLPTLSPAHSPLLERRVRTSTSCPCSTLVNPQCPLTHPPPAPPPSSPLSPPPHVSPPPSPPHSPLLVRRVRTTTSCP
jgi:hypothetical protein